MAAFNGTFEKSLQLIDNENDDEFPEKSKADNLEELRKCLNIGQVWWNEVLKDMFLTTTFRKVSYFV